MPNKKNIPDSIRSRKGFSQSSGCNIFVKQPPGATAGDLGVMKNQK